MERAPKDREFEAALRFFMKKHDWDEFELARMSGFRVAPAAIRAWLSGLNEPSNKSVRVLCQTFEVHRWWFWYLGHEIVEGRLPSGAAAVEPESSATGGLDVAADLRAEERLLSGPAEVRERLFALVAASR